MKFIDKIFSPLRGKNNNRKYQDLSKESQRVEFRPPSELLLFSRDIAGEQIQKHMEILNDCRWIRADYTYPSFDDMCFIYTNNVFSVIIDIQDETDKSYLPEEYIRRQLYVCNMNNIIPCKFPVVVPNPTEPDFSLIKQKHNGWNLFHTQTNKEIIPEHISTTEKIKMSEWELRNFAIKYTIKYLQSLKMKVCSYQDTLEVDPQIWFEDSNGKKCWLLVRSEVDKKVKKPEKLNEIIRRCFKNEGYLASMTFSAVNDNPKDKNIYRLGNIQIDFQGIEKIHSVL